MNPRLEQQFREYRSYHLHPVNVAIHKVAVPAILFHIVVMLDWVPLGPAVGGRPVTLGVAAVVLAGAWYLRMSLRYALVVVPFAALCLVAGRFVPAWAVIVVAVIAWLAQLVGHARFERRAPAFTDNVVQLLVGPAYVAALLLGDREDAADDAAGA